MVKLFVCLFVLVFLFFDTEVSKDEVWVCRLQTVSDTARKCDATQYTEYAVHRKKDTINISTRFREALCSLPVLISHSNCFYFV